MKKTKHPSATSTARPHASGDAADCAVEAHHLVKRYRDKTVVDGISLEIRRGETFGILGTNGAGKTTTVEMIAGLRRPGQGSVRILGLDPFRDRTVVRQLLGVQLQEAYLHGSLTCRELVDLYRSLYPEPLETAEALSLVELTERARTKFDDLSGGQMQRLSIALALIGRPRVVILDELTTGLDPRARRRIWSTIESLTEQTVILVSHAMDEVERLCDRVALLHEGRVLALGTPAQITADARAESLEEAFVQLTGHEIEPEEEDR